MTFNYCFCVIFLVYFQWTAANSLDTQTARDYHVNGYFVDQKRNHLFRHNERQLEETKSAEHQISGTNWKIFAAALIVNIKNSMSAQKQEKRKNYTPQNRPRQQKNSKLNLPSRPTKTKDTTNSTPVSNSTPTASTGGWAAIAATKTDTASPQPPKQTAPKQGHSSNHQPHHKETSTKANSNRNTTNTAQSNYSATDTASTATTKQSRKRSQSPIKKKNFNSDEVLSFLQDRTEALMATAKTFKQGGTDWSKPVKAKKDHHRTQDVVNFELVKHLRKRRYRE